MEQSWKTLFLLTFFCTFGLITSAKAQITPDNSLGAETSTVVQPNQAINGIPINQIDQINGGARRQGNLFHSFGEFNVNAGRAAYFTNPDGVANILTRVTGVNRSNILGTLGVLGNANLFLINPNGIFFGPNARLDLGGSFFGSTANSLIFDNGFEFSTTNAIAPPLLTVNIPVGLRFRDNPGNITNASSNFGLEVLSGQTLALVGGDVSLDGGVLIALGGKVELGGLKAAGTVGINNDGSLSFPESVERGDVLLTNASFVDLRGGGGGTIAVNARNLELSGESILATGIRQDFGSVGSQAGNIEIDATGAVKISGGSFIFNSLPSRTTGNSGDINIKAESVFLDNAQLQASNPGQGNAGNITVQAKDTISLANFSFILSNVGSRQGVPANGNVGNILLDARVVSLTDTSQLQAGFFANAQGNPGSVSIRARESVSFTGQNSGIFANVDRGGLGDGSDVEILAESFSLKDGAVLTTDNAGQGNGGDIAINVGSLSVTNDSLITSSTFGEGNAGKLFIKAGDLVEVLGTGEPGTDSSISANVFSGATGNGGDLTIDTKKLVVRNAQVGASVFGRGNAGNVRVIATESVELSGKVFSIGESGQIIRNPAGLFAQVNIDGEGKGGNLTIDTPRLSVGDGAKVQVATFGQGDAGNLLIRASDIDVYETANADFFAGGIFAGLQVDEDETRVLPRGGSGGTLTIETDRLRVRDGGTVSAFTEGEGNAGTLRITAKDSVEVYGTSPNGKFTSEITAGATAQSIGSGGSLSINTDKLIVRDRGRVTVSSLSTKPAGNLEITARTINLDNQGSLTATTSSGDGGNITLNVRDYLFMRRNSEISTSASGNGNGGNIIIDAPFIVAFPSNNDITANAGSGSGGQVRINATLFGIAPLSAADLRRLRPNDLDPRQLPTSDITAISRDNPSLNNNVQVTSPDVDPSRGLVELPETVTDPTQQIAQSPCQQGLGNEFVVTGRGGLPTTPNQTLSSDNVRVDLLQPVASSGNSRSAAIKPATNPTATRVPAQGWIFNDKGQVVLTAYDPTNTGSQRSWRTAAACPAR
ncbi:filamentous hemagglutinin N-terminal domain-containing protein [Tolypothrix sp. VBCCA 56010]|uniref:two-partner secretion domain-containing protein n=1 Tax=Tolypothrix sp. VBCCA 56010 TaxID=3137731 RepID=UPI003D7EBDF0